MTRGKRRVCVRAYGQNSAQAILDCKLVPRFNSCGRLHLHARSPSLSPRDTPTVESGNGGVRQDRTNMATHHASHHGRNADTKSQGRRARGSLLRVSFAPALKRSTGPRRSWASLPYSNHAPTSIHIIHIHIHIHSHGCCRWESCQQQRGCPCLAHGIVAVE